MSDDTTTRCSCIPPDECPMCMESDLDSDQFRDATKMVQAVAKSAPTDAKSASVAETTTPRTDYAVELAITREWVRIDFARQLERELTVSLENQVKTQAEVERLKVYLARAVEIALMIWGDKPCDKPWPQIRAELDQLKEPLTPNTMTPNDTTTNDKCHVCTEEQQCWECASDVSVPDTPRTDELLYGRPESNIGLSPQQAAFKIVDFARQLERELAASNAEVERLKKLLSDLLILTEKHYWNSTNYNQIKAALNPNNK